MGQERPYDLGGMEDVLRTTLASYMPKRTGDEMFDRLQLDAFAAQVRAIMYRMQGLDPAAREDNYHKVPGWDDGDYERRAVVVGIWDEDSDNG